MDAQNLIVAIDPSHKEAGAYDVKKSLLRVKHADGEYQVSEDVIRSGSDLEAEVFYGDDVSVQEVNKLLYSTETLRKTNFEDRGDVEELNVEQEG